MPATKVLAAVGLAWAGWALMLLRAGSSERSQRVGRVLGLLVALVGLAVCFEYLFGALGIDQLVFRDTGVGVHGRPSPHTAVALLAIGCALASVGSRLLPRWVQPVLLAIAWIVVEAALVGRIYGVDYLQGARGVTGMSLPTLAGLIVLTMGLMALRPDRGVAGLLRGDDAGARIARTMLPVAVLGPVLLGGARFALQQAGLFGLKVGLTVFTLSMVFLLTAVVLGLAGRARRADELARHGASTVASSADAIFRCVGDVIVHANPAAEAMFGYSPGKLVGVSALTLTPPERQAESRKVLERMRRGLVSRIDTQRVRRDGTRFDVAVTVSPIRDHAGVVTGVSVIASDISERKRAELEARQATARLQAMFDYAPAGLSIRDLDGRYLQVNRVVAEALGSTPEALLGRDPAEHLDAEQAARLAADDQQMIDTHQATVSENRVVDAHGTAKDFYVVKYPVLDENGEVTGFGAFSIDMTERRQVERERERALEQLRDAQQTARMGSWWWDPTANQADWSEETFRIFGRDPAAGPAVGPQILAYIHTDDRDRLAAGLAGTSSGGPGFEVDCRIVAEDGSEKVIHTVGRPDRANPGCYVGTIQDVTDQRRHQAELERLATQDPLTGLANHRVFHEQLTAEVARAARHDRQLSIAILDLDHFKQINDRCGHGGGDRALVAVSDRLAALARDGEVIARVGGEEFAWILPDADGIGAFAAAERARQAIAALTIPDVGRLTLSIGVCDLAHARNSADLYKHADQALYWAKGHGRNQTFRYSTEGAEQLRTTSPTETGELDIFRQKTLVELTAAAEAKHPDFADHGRRVAELVGKLAFHAGWKPDRIDALREAARLHDIGKLAVSDSIVDKAGPLTGLELQQLHTYPAVGAEMLSVALTPAQTSWIRHHHEHWDGTGHPDQLAREQIPPGAQLIAFADAYDAMTHPRPGRHQPLPRELAILELQSSIGKRFSPDLLPLIDHIATAASSDRTTLDNG